LTNSTKDMTTMLDTEKQKLVYILSPSFSGSTLLTLLLAQHPKIATIGELKATAMGDIESYQCSCGSPLLECEFWKTLQSRLHGKKMKFALDDFHTHFTSSNVVWNRIMGAQVRGKWFELLRSFLLEHTPCLKREYQNRLLHNWVFAQTVTDIMKRPMFLDGSKDVNRLKYLLGDDRWDIRVLEIIRDGRAQSNSRRSKNRRFIPSFKHAVKEWRSTIKQMAMVTKQLPSEQIYSMSYETLCEKTSEVLTEICEFLEIEPLGFDWSNIDLKKTEHHILGNNMRTKTHIKISLDSNWKSEVTQEELGIFESLAGELNRNLGKRLNTNYES